MRFAVKTAPQHTSRIKLGCQVSGMPYRHPKIECSVNIRYDPKTGASAVADTAHKWVEAGADYAVINFAPPHSPEPLAAIAAALALPDFLTS